ncbi:cation diffusion facilitator family transporter [Rickettsiella endosymbiont of Miltochrista miniata]|uniref:cation diffusion facilitator family transporter n=1 Tax=Rickettsiella endosymbiont of Miltochrista miniata TaxID=3066239 RepID=UPI00313ADD08
MSHTHHHHPTFVTLNVSFAVAILLNSGFLLTEVVYGFIAHSVSLLSDAVHNFGDVLGLLMSWGASVLVKRRATQRYSYGYKKLTILAALANALLLVLTSALIVYESINRLNHPKEINEIIVIIVAFIGMLINGGTALLFMRQSTTDLNIKGAFLHLAYDALIALGVVLAGAVIYFTGWLWVDPIVGLLIVAIITWGSWNLLRRSVELILGAVPYGVNQKAVYNYLKELPGVQEVHDLHIWGLSTQETALTAHLIMPKGGFSDEEYLKINRVLAKEFHIQHITLQVEQGQKKYPCEQSLVC